MNTINADFVYDAGNAAEAAMGGVTYIANAFSPQMVALDNYDVQIRTLAPEEFDEIKTKFESVVGHPDTARVLGVECNRKNVSLNIGDTLFVAQLTGGRLPEGATTLPQGFKFKYLRVDIIPPRI